MRIDTCCICIKTAYNRIFYCCMRAIRPYMCVIRPYMSINGTYIGINRACILLSKTYNGLK